MLYWQWVCLFVCLLENLVIEALLVFDPARTTGITTSNSATSTTTTSSSVVRSSSSSSRSSSGAVFQTRRRRLLLVRWMVNNEKSKIIIDSVPSSSRAQPIDPSGWPMKFPAKEYCSKCGLCETTLVESVKDACAFLENGMSRIDLLEPIVHDGRSRHDNNNDDANDETHFGVLYQPIQLVRGKNMPGAQWTGVVTSIALAMLETGQVDAVVCVATATPNNTDKNDDNQKQQQQQQQQPPVDLWSYPEPIVARTVEDLLRGRGVKPALAPTLRVLDEIRQSRRKLLFCGVGCAVQAFRAIQPQLMLTTTNHLEDVYVLGTNCADNSPTPQAATNFIHSVITDLPRQSVWIRGYEFMPDYRVHVKIEDSVTNQPGYITRPYFSLPPHVAESAIAYSCRACFDYTNACADVVVGYMGATPTMATTTDADGTVVRMDDLEKSQQTLTIRNARGAHMVQTALQQDRLWINPNPPLDEGKHQFNAIQTVLADTLISNLLPSSNKADSSSRPQPAGLPIWLGNAMATIMSWVGPKGLAFARYSIDYHILRNFFHVLHACQGDEEKTFGKLPSSAVRIVKEYLRSSKELELLKGKIQGQFRQ